MPIADPAVRFFLRFAEADGGLVEEAWDKAVVLLTADQRRVMDVPEELVVTADPDAAREEGAVLLAPGHPLLSAAVDRVLEGGDAGRACLAWPRSAPSPETLLERARDQFPVEHGRLDPCGELAPIYTPILRVGALLTYAVSLDHRFQEREEAFIDARTQLVLDESTRDALVRRELLTEPDTAHPSLLPDLEPALREAHAAFERRAATRLETFAGEAREELDAELARAKDYYDSALRSLERRGAAAGTDRRPLFEARAEATRAERARRLSEIEEKYRASYEIRPFRFHLLLAPALLVPMRIRRGERRYSFSLTWLLGAPAFAPVRCPHCGEAEMLVAGRERAGCRACLPSSAPPVSPAPAAGLAPSPIPRRPPASSLADLRPQTSANGAPLVPRGRTRHGAERAVASKKTRPPAQTKALDEARARRVFKEGSKLATRLWETVGSGERWPNKAMAPDSPARTLHRLYGAAGPMVGVGIDLDEILLRLSATTADPYPGLLEATTGTLITNAAVYPYTLRWRLEEARPVLFEVLPFPKAVDDSFPSERTLAPRAAARLYRDAPLPAGALDAVALHLWESFLPGVGLPLIVRCLAAWWRIPDPPNAPAPVLATALVRTLGARARSQRARTAVAECGLDLEAVARTSGDLRRILGVGRGRSR